MSACRGAGKGKGAAHASAFAAACAAFCRALAQATRSASAGLGGAALVLACLAPTSAQETPLPGAMAVAPDASASQSTQKARAVDARIAGDSHRTRLIVDLDRPVQFRVFTLANPYRVIVDLPDVAFTFPQGAVLARRGLVGAYRYGEFAPGKARMVLDLTEPVTIDKAFVLEAAADQPARLVVDLVRTDAASFAATVATAAEARGAPVAAVQSHALQPDADPRPMIVIDPGHGGIDSGTTGASAYAEKNIVLDVALALRTRLEASGRYRVTMTRATDTFVPLGERVRIARAARAALFISIHADALAANDGQARGASVYTLSETASDSDAARLAESENRADLIAGIDLSEESDEVAGILFDLAQRETRNFSAMFARTLVGAMKSAGKVHKAALKSAGFRVLKAHDVPSVLVEIGYMSSREDLKLMTSDAWRDRVAQVMGAAVDDFFSTRTAGVTGSVPEPASGR